MLKMVDSKLRMYIKLIEHLILARTWVFGPRQNISTWKGKINQEKQIYFRLTIMSFNPRPLEPRANTCKKITLSKSLSCCILGSNVY